MNSFGGDWTEEKIEILVEYAQAYLKVMNKRSYWKLLYFDGFAGSGFIEKNNELDSKSIIGAAKRIIELNKPRSFDEYYFVEKDYDNYISLKKNTRDTYPNKTIYTVESDCNEKLLGLAGFLKKEGENHKVLAYIDPCGMQLEWKSIEKLKGLSVDLWVLVPTGLGVNRLLKKNGEISNAWLEKLEKFLGLDRNNILNHFYQEEKQLTLFGEETKVTKKEKAIEQSAILYKNRLSEIFKFVSEPFILKNSSNSIMFHFFMASNNKTAQNIANDIITKHNTKNV